MYKFHRSTLILFTLLTILTAQTIPQIKSSSDYLWGEGKAQRPENLVGFQNLQGLGVHAPGKNLAGLKDLQGLAKSYKFIL